MCASRRPTPRTFRRTVATLHKKFFTVPRSPPNKILMDIQHERMKLPETDADIAAAKWKTASEAANRESLEERRRRRKQREHLGKREKKKEVNVMDERRQKRLDQLDKARQKSENRKSGGKAARPVWDALDRFAPKKIKKKVRG